MTIAQLVTAVTNLAFVVVLAGGYYFTWRASQQTLAEMREQRTAMGRPLVIVQEDYDALPELDVAIPSTRTDALLAALRDATSGRAVCAVREDSLWLRDQS